MVEKDQQIGKRLEDKTQIPDGIGDEYKVSAVKGLGFLSYVGQYRKLHIDVNTTTDSDRTIPALHDDYKASLWRFAEKTYGVMKYRALPIEESELDRLTDPKEDAWMERWFGKIGIEDDETKDTFYRELFKDQILAAKYVLVERGYKVISRVEHQEIVKTGQRSLRWWIVGAAATMLLIAAGALVGTGLYVYKEYVKPFNKLREDVESGDIVYRFPRIGISESDIEKIKDAFKNMSPEERRELLFGVPPGKKKGEEKEEEKKKEEKKVEEEKPEELPQKDSEF